MSTIWFADVETGGAEEDGRYGNKYSILSIALIKWQNGKQCQTYESFIKEDPIIVSPEAMQINKIDLSDETIGWKTPRTVASEIRTLVTDSDSNDRTLCAQNPIFDIGYIKRLFCLGGVKYPFHYRIVDTASITQFLNEAGKIKTETNGLKSLCNYFGIKMENYHTALGDVRILIQVYEKLLEVIKSD